MPETLLSACLFRFPNGMRGETLPGLLATQYASGYVGLLSAAVQRLGVSLGGSSDRAGRQWRLGTEGTWDIHWYKGGMEMGRRDDVAAIGGCGASRSMPGL